MNPRSIRQFYVRKLTLCPNHAPNEIEAKYKFPKVRQSLSKRVGYINSKVVSQLWNSVTNGFRKFSVRLYFDETSNKLWVRLAKACVDFGANRKSDIWRILHRSQHVVRIPFRTCLYLNKNLLTVRRRSLEVPARLIWASGKFEVIARESFLKYLL